MVSGAQSKMVGKVRRDTHNFSKNHCSECVVVSQQALDLNRLQTGPGEGGGNGIRVTRSTARSGNLVHANEIVVARTVRGDRKATKPKPTRIAYFVVMVAPPTKSALNLQQSRYPAWNMRKQRLCRNLDCQPWAHNFIYCASFFTV